MTDRVRVCPVDELEPGEHVVVDVEGVPIGVLNVDGEYYGLLNRCPHQRGPVCAGRVKRKRVVTSAEPNERVEIELSEERTISCPRHGWEYDLETGDHLGNPSVSLPTFDVTVEDDDLYVHY